ncbi:hypothetical protein PR001_g23292 [Phytophthora rubi]|nr:hypothetical protein PR001_g23292 [Phytophthora rubi]
MVGFRDRLAAPIAQPQLSAPLHPPTCAPTHALSKESKLDRLVALLHELKEQVNASTEPAPTVLPTPPTHRNGAGDVGVSGTFGSGSGPDAVTTAWTVPPCGHPADMPPAAIQHQRCASFPAPRSRAKGEYYPSQAHQLAAHRLYKTLSSEDGAYTSPMALVLQLRELECARFEAIDRYAAATPWFNEHQFCDGLRGWCRVAGEDTAVSTYEDLLAAISGLTSFGDALFYDHVHCLTSRLKRFVLANMERDTNMERDKNTPERVTLTLLYVNNPLGRAMTHLVEDSPEW